MRIHTTAELEHNPRYRAVVEAASAVIAEELNDQEGVSLAWDREEGGALRFALVDQVLGRGPVSMQLVSGSRREFDRVRAGIRAEFRPAIAS